MRTFITPLVLIGIFPSIVSATAQYVADFEGLLTQPETHFTGNFPAQVTTTTFYSGGIGFQNTSQTFPGGFTSWAGFGYSNTTDNTTAGFTNDYSALPGSGAEGSGAYGVSFDNTTLTLPEPTTVISLDVANTTYAGLNMLEGDGFSPKFGDNPATAGTVETDFPDFFKLLITGRDAAGQTTGNVEVLLADYRSADDADDFVLDTWQNISLATLGTAVASMDFAYESSRFNDFGPLTPTYFALDNLTVASVPEPAAGVLLLTVAGVCLVRRRRAA